MGAFVIALLALCPLSSAFAADGERTIVIDGAFDDWRHVTPAWSDAPGDAGTSGIDFGELRLWSDAERLYLFFETGREINLQGERGPALLIETDDDATTGRAVNGLGVDFEWHFGEREGIVFGPEGRERLRQGDVGLRQAPTVSSDRFEVSFSRDMEGAGVTVLDPGTIRIILKDRPDGDVVPDPRSVLEYTLRETPPPDRAEGRLERRDPSHVRVLTYNVLFDGLFERPERFRRIIRAIDPDVVCFQEIFRHGPDAVAASVADALGMEGWHAVGEDDCFVASRFPIARSRVLGPVDENVWALVDLPDDAYGPDLSIVSAHPPCCAKTDERQEEFDAIMAWLRGLRPGAGPAGVEPVPAGTPTVVAGDMNLVTASYQLRTLTDGAIRDTARYGPAFAPDWDGTALEDAFPLHLTGLEAYTWRNDDDTYAPGRLDFIVYSDSVVSEGRSFVLWTPDLPYETIRRYGLRPEDTEQASDHLPVVVDLVVPPPDTR